jgi:hypothetical protein
MPFKSFEKLLSLICPQLEIHEEMAILRGGPIMPELALYAMLQHLAGGSYSDIHFFTGISTSAEVSIGVSLKELCAMVA